MRGNRKLVFQNRQNQRDFFSATLNKFQKEKPKFKVNQNSRQFFLNQQDFSTQPSLIVVKNQTLQKKAEQSNERL